MPRRPASVVRDTRKLEAGGAPQLNELTEGYIVANDKRRSRPSRCQGSLLKPEAARARIKHCWTHKESALKNTNSVRATSSKIRIAMPSSKARTYAAPRLPLSQATTTNLGPPVPRRPQPTQRTGPPPVLRQPPRPPQRAPTYRPGATRSDDLARREAAMAQRAADVARREAALAAS